MKPERAARPAKAAKAIRLLVIAIGALLFIDAAFNALVTNFNSGLLALGVFSIALIVYGALLGRGRIAKWVHAAVIVVCALMVSL